jgi:beta-lactam-binding protein with PASTA domain
MTRAEAEAELREIGLKANAFEVPSIDPAGTVVAQNPAGGEIREGSSVRINVSSGETP